MVTIRRKYKLIVVLERGDEGSREGLGRTRTREREVRGRAERQTSLTRATLDDP